jgi:tetratricopeptide (TPR) repeat protein
MSVDAQVSDCVNAMCSKHGCRLDRFVKAVKYIGEAVRLGEQHLAIAESQLSGYYCNYAEALFHAGRRSEALQAAHRAVEIARCAHIH